MTRPRPRPLIFWKNLKEKEGNDHDQEEDEKGDHPLPGSEHGDQGDGPFFLMKGGEFSNPLDHSSLNPFYEHIINIFLISSNFFITEPVWLSIKDLDGIEAIKLLSPYRMLIVIGDLFDVEKVQVEVNRKINALFKNK